MRDQNHIDVTAAFIWFGLIGALVTVVNNMVAIFALGVAQGPIVAFTTPFAFCLGKLRYPRLPGASLIFLLVIVVSIFTLNLGPPGPYKVLYLFGAILYDLICYILGVGLEKKGKISLWKLILAIVFYPIGLVLGGLLAISWVAVEIPILSKAWAGVILMILLFMIVGGFSTWLCRRLYYARKP